MFSKRTFTPALSTGTVPGVIRKILKFFGYVLLASVVVPVLGLTASAQAQTRPQQTPEAFEDAKSSILVLHSYHPGFTWTDNITKGLTAAFADYVDRIELDIEYMNTRRIYTDAYFRELVELYRMKYGGKKFDVIICADDQALNFVLGLGKELFAGVPIVFCSVSGWDPSMRANRQITGLLESIIPYGPDCISIVVFVCFEIIDSNVFNS